MPKHWKLVQRPCLLGWRLWRAWLGANLLRHLGANLLRRTLRLPSRLLKKAWLPGAIKAARQKRHRPRRGVRGGPEVASVDEIF
jgi:hypothetical protein